MRDDLYTDKFHFELPVWILVHKDDTYMGDDGRVRIRLPGKLEGASTTEGRFVSVYTDEDLAKRSLEEVHRPDVVAPAIADPDEFKRLLEFVLASNTLYFGVDPGAKKTGLIAIEPFLKEMD